MSVLTIAIPVFPGVDLLDVVGPVEVLGAPDAGPSDHTLRVVTVAPTRRASEVVADPPFRFVTDLGRGDSLAADVVLVPGGPGLTAVLADPSLRRWPAELAEGARWVGSICAGALWLAAAGLLRGYAATTHWASLGLLERFDGVTVVPDRSREPVDYPTAVFDRDRFTSGGVSTALDASLRLREALLGAPSGREAELLLQYAPEPPFGTGTPALADPETLRRVTGQLAPMIRARHRVIDGIVRPSGL